MSTRALQDYYVVNLMQALPSLEVQNPNFNPCVIFGALQ